MKKTNIKEKTRKLRTQEQILKNPVIKGEHRRKTWLLILPNEHINMGFPQKWSGNNWWRRKTKKNDSQKVQNEKIKNEDGGGGMKATTEKKN